jgi:hypothetical protein
MPMELYAAKEGTQFPEKSYLNRIADGLPLSAFICVYLRLRTALDRIGGHRRPSAVSFRSSPAFRHRY